MQRRIYLLIVFLFFLQDLFAQCSMCKAVAQDEVDEEGATGINNGIMYLLIFPYVIVFIVFRKRIFEFFRELRKATGEKS